MNWTLPLGISIGTFVGLYLSNRSVALSVFGAIVALVVSSILSIVWTKRANRK